MGQQPLEEIQTFIQSTLEDPSFQNIKTDLEDPRDILRKSNLPYLPIKGFDVPYAKMLEEAKNLKDVMVPHRSYKESHKGWRGICVHGISSAHSQCASVYGMEIEDPSIYRWTDISRFAPVTTDFFKNHFTYDIYHRVRFMLLEPGGYILPHADFDFYVLGPVNIALNNPEGCGFYMKGAGLIPFQPGSVNKLALVNQHAVFNDSNEDRFHIIVHGAPNWQKWAPIYQESYRSFINEKNFTR